MAWGVTFKMQRPQLQRFTHLCLCLLCGEPNDMHHHHLAIPGFFLPYTFARLVQALLIAMNSYMYLPNMLKIILIHCSHPTLLVLTIFLPPLLTWSLNLRRRGWKVDVLFRAGYSSLILCILTLVSLCVNHRLLWKEAFKNLLCSKPKGSPFILVIYSRPWTHIYRIATDKLFLTKKAEANTLKPCWQHSRLHPGWSLVALICAWPLSFMFATAVCLTCLFKLGIFFSILSLTIIHFHNFI